MKKLTLLLCVILVVLLGLTALFYVGGTLSARPGAHAAGAADYPDAFEAIRGVLKSGAAPQVFESGALGEDPAGYTLVDITIDLYNRGLFTAEWLDIALDGAPGDVAVYSLSGVGSDIEARGSGQVNLKLITAAAADAPRAVDIHYYVYGLKRTIRVKIS